MDWASVVPSAITGVVGIVGIVGTSWQGKRSREAQSRDLQRSIDAAAGNLRLGIRAEDERADKAEKRRIYARHLAACTEVARVWIIEEQAGEDELSAHLEFGVAVAAVVASASEVELIAPEEIGNLAHKAGRAAGRVAPTGQAAPDDYNDVRQRLVRAMRADLGEPGTPASNQGHQGDPPSGGGA